MVNIGLSPALIRDGEELVEKLDKQHSLTVEAAYWSYNSDVPEPKLIFSIPERRTQGPTPIYRLIQRAMKKAPVASQLRFENIELSRTDEPLVRTLHSHTRVIMKNTYLTNVGGDPSAWLYLYRLSP